jgi:hypothetical protein
MYRSSRDWLEAPSEPLSHPLRTMKRCPYRSAAGLVGLAVAIFVGISVFPEIRRYLRMERM